MATTNSVEEYNRLRALLDEQQREKHQADGAIKEQLKVMQSKYGCATLKEAKKLLAQKEEKLRVLTKKRDDLLRKFQEEYGDKLG